MDDFDEFESFKVAIVARMKHGILWEALRKRGWNQRQGAEFFGMDQQSFGRMINMKAIPNFTDEFISKLIEFTGMSPDEVFPEFIRRKEFLEMDKIRETFLSLTPLQLAEKHVYNLPPAPDEIVARKELEALIESGFGVLDARETEILKRVVIEDESLTEVGRDLNISKERVRQILESAKDKIRMKDSTRTKWVDILA